MAQCVRAHKHGHRHKGSQGVTVQPWVDTWGHSTAMGRQRGSQYSHGQTLGVTVHTWVDKGGGSQYSNGQTKGVTVTVQPWADTRGRSTAMGRH